MYQIQFIATPILKRVTAHFFLKNIPVFAKSPFFERFLYIDGDGEIVRNLMHPIRFKNVMAIKASCEKLMAITDGPMDHHRHVR